MEKKFNFVYITTNLINGKQYVGDHSTNNIDDNYLGSGRPYFQNALNEYGKDNFKREILEFFSTKQEAFNAQEKYIKQYNTLTPNGYNISPTGGHNVKDCFSQETIEKNRKSNTGKKHTEESKKKMSKARKKENLSEETLKKRSNSLKGKVPWNKGIKLSQETKKKISLSNTGEKNAFFGKTHTAFSKAKISQSRKEREIAKGPKNGMYGKSFFSIWIEKYGEEEAKKMKDEMYKNRSKNRGNK